MSLYKTAKGKSKYHQSFTQHKCCHQKGMWLERKCNKALLNTVGCVKDLITVTENKGENYW